MILHILGTTITSEPIYERNGDGDVIRSPLYMSPRNSELWMFQYESFGAS